VVQHPIAPQTQLLNSMTAFDPDSIRARMITAKLSGGARIARVGDAPTGSPLESELAKVEREFTQRQFDPVVRQDRSFLPEMDVIKEQAKRGDRNMQIGILMGKATDLINEAQDPESKRQAMEAYVFLSKVQDEYQGMYAENPLEANSFLQKAAYGAAQSARDKQLFLSILAVFIGIVFLILIVYICDEIKNKFFPAVLRTVKHWDSDAQGAHIGGVRMNGLQRIILFISFVFVVGMCAFPPWFEVNHNGVKNAYGYHLIVNPPETYSSHGYEIDLPRLAVQILIVAGAGAAVFVFCAGGSRER